MADQSTYASVNETARQHFEAAWRDGKSARIEEHLPSPDDPRYLATLEELVHIELEMKWKAQHADDATAVATIAVPRVEEYLVRFPRLNEPIIVLRLLKQEYRVRHLYGDQPAASEYRDRFPQIVIDGREVETRMPKRTSDALPQLDGYEVLEELGHGGMGVVYKARQIGLDRIVALKMIRAGASANEEDRVRFQVEAEASAQLRHPNIVQIYEVGDKDGLPFFSLEFVEGGSLDRALSGNPQEPRDAATLIETLARAMHYAHEQGVIHRDLKPANVLLQIADRIMQNESTPQSAIGNLQSAIPKITDFGLAKRLEADSKQTQTGAVLGTPSYMAPEQATAKKDIGPAADIYALGAILYEMLTGRPPFRGPSAWDTLNQVVHDEPVPPSQLQPTVPRDLETICLKCLEKAPANRYASAQALADDLERWLSGEAIQARPTGTLERTLKWVRRQPVVAGLLLAIVLVALAGFSGVLWKYRDAELQRATRSGREESRIRVQGSKG
ncbi:MAG: serine/threonine protein kinase [Planctomycetes bacterium]|nr:serine/threonine protein kinase [Planctomycetota bacterium]